MDIHLHIHVVLHLPVCYCFQGHPQDWIQLNLRHNQCQLRHSQDRTYSYLWVDPWVSLSLWTNTPGADSSTCRPQWALSACPAWPTSSSPSSLSWPAKPVLVTHPVDPVVSQCTPISSYSGTPGTSPLPCCPQSALSTGSTGPAASPLLGSTALALSTSSTSPKTLCSIVLTVLSSAFRLL